LLLKDDKLRLSGLFLTLPFFIQEALCFILFLLLQHGKLLRFLCSEKGKCNRHQQTYESEDRRLNHHLAQAEELCFLLELWQLRNTVLPDPQLLEHLLIFLFFFRYKAISEEKTRQKLQWDFYVPCVEHFAKKPAERTNHTTKNHIYQQ
jgi:hypothetical protein